MTETVHGKENQTNTYLTIKDEVSKEESVETSKEEDISKNQTDNIVLTIEEKKDMIEKTTNDAREMDDNNNLKETDSSIIDIQDDELNSFASLNEQTLEKSDDLSEIDFDLPENSNSIHIKRPIDVYREIYAKALKKAAEARRLAVQAFLEAKHIKNTFLANDESDDYLANLEENIT